MKIHIHLNRPVANRMAILHRRPEFPFLHRFNRLFIQAHPQTGAHPDIAGRSVGLDDDAEHAKPLELGLARLFGEFRVNLRNDGRITGSLATMKQTATGAAALPRAKSSALAGPDSPATSRANAALRARAV